MTYINIVKELTKRKVENAMKSVKKSKELKALVRSSFLNKIIDSEGRELLKYCEITNDPYEPILSSEVSKHIKKCTNITFNQKQLGMMHMYLAKLGAIYKKKVHNNYFLKLKLKRIP